MIVPMLGIREKTHRYINTKQIFTIVEEACEKGCLMYFLSFGKEILEGL